MLALRTLPTHIFCIEEDAYYSQLLQCVFKKTGDKWNPTFNLIDNGEDALSFLCEGYYRNLELPELILLDIDMNKNDGFEILKSLKENSSLQEIPIIILSFSDSGAKLAKCILLGADGFVTKPSDYKRLIPLIQAVWCDIPQKRY